MLLQPCIKCGRPVTDREVSFYGSVQEGGHITNGKICASCHMNQKFKIKEDLANSEKLLLG